MSRYCSSCGQRLGDDYRYCTNCGTKVAAAEGIPGPSGAQPEARDVEMQGVKATVAEGVPEINSAQPRTFDLKKNWWALVLKIVGWVLSIAWLTSGIDAVLASSRWIGFIQILLGILVNPWVIGQFRKPGLDTGGGENKESVDERWSAVMAQRPEEKKREDESEKPAPEGKRKAVAEDEF